MPTLTDPSVAAAVRQMYKASVELRRIVQDALDLVDDQHRVISSLHDLVEECEQRQGAPLRSVS